MDPLRCAAKFDPFLSLDCARVEGGGGAQSKERKGSNFAAQRSGAIVLQARRAKHIQSKNQVQTHAPSPQGQQHHLEKMGARSLNLSMRLRHQPKKLQKMS